MKAQSTDLLDVSLGLGVERTSKVGLVSLEISRAANWVSIVVGVDAAGSKDSDVDALHVASIGQVQGSDDIVSDGLLLVVLAPVDIWAASRSGGVEDMCGLNFLQLSNNGLSVLHANGCGVDLLALRGDQHLIYLHSQRRVDTYLGSRGESSSGQRPNLHLPRSRKRAWMPL